MHVWPRTLVCLNVIYFYYLNDDIYHISAREAWKQYDDDDDVDDDDDDDTEEICVVKCKWCFSLGAFYLNVTSVVGNKTVELIGIKLWHFWWGNKGPVCARQGVFF